MFASPSIRSLAAALCTLSLAAAACGNDVDVGEFGGGGAGAGVADGAGGADGEAGASTTSTGSGATTATNGTGGAPGSTGSGDGGAGGVSSSSGEAGATSVGQGGAAPDVCGGLAEGGEDTCGGDAWCDYPDDSFCGGDDSTGLCQPRPQSCDFDFAIVCGCDGEVYSNECFAHLAGSDVSTTEQACGLPCGGLTGETCAADEYCQYEGDSCGLGDEQGVCVQRPGSCDGFPLEQPVCGCDGVDYDTPCEAAFAGFDVWGGEDLCGGG